MTYDDVGNILSKTGVGHDFQYSLFKNRLMSYTSDGYEGKLWNAIEYTSFNKISYIESQGKSMTLTYGPDKSRIMTVMEDDGTVTETKYYAGSYYEEICGNDGEVRKINYIFAGGKAVAIFETSNRAADLLRYVHHDHLGSVSAYTDENGNLVQELSYDAWGRRRNPVNWEYYSSTEDADAWHPRGFGGHEHLDVFDMVNMDGRMYDPVVGRFLSPDPYIQMPDFTQSLNRYAYCINNPLSLTDPTGYNWMRNFFATTVGIAVGLETAGLGVKIYGAIIGGAIGGASSALVGSLLNGANLWQTTKNVFTGAFWGAASGAMNFEIGEVKDVLSRIALHSISEGVVEAIQGGHFEHGLLVGLTSSAGGELISRYGSNLPYAGQIAANATLGGLVSELIKDHTIG